MGFDNVNVNVSGPVQPISTYKTKVLKGNHSFASQVTEANVKYVIKHDFVLDGDVTIPTNCVLEFDGGSLSNGSLIGNNTTIVNDSNGKIFSDITFSGTYRQDYICSDWFEYEEFYKMFDAISVLATSDILTNIVIKQITITYDGPVRGSYLGEKTGYLFDVPSNIDIDFCGSVLTLAPNDISFFYVLNISNKNNVKVRNITVVGDVEGHTPTQHNEYVHGIYITSSSNVELDNCKSNKFWGDGMCVTKVSINPNHCVNVTVKNSIFDSNRRQGCSISEGENIYFENCEFLNTGTIAGTSPDAGVDIEPNGAGAVIKNIVFSKCKFLGNEGTYGGVLIMTAQLTEDVDAEEIKFINCDIDGIHHYGKGGCHLESCVISNSKNRSNCLNFSKNAIIKDCIITFAKENLVTNATTGMLVIGNRFTADYNYNSFSERLYNRCFSATIGTVNGQNKAIVISINKSIANYGGIDIELASNTEDAKGVYKVRFVYNGEKLVKVWESNFDMQFPNSNIRIAQASSESIDDGTYLKVCIIRNNSTPVTAIDVYGIIRSICGGVILRGIPVSNIPLPPGFTFPQRFVPYVYSGSTLPTVSLGGGAMFKGDMFFDDAEGINSPAFYDGTKWVDANGVKVLRKRGTIGQRPLDNDVKDILGFKYYDELNNRELTWNGATWMTNDGELVLYKYKSEPLSDFTYQRYIKTNVAVGATVDLTEVYGNHNCKVIELNANNVVALKGVGGDVCRMWALIDAENKLLSNYESMAAGATIPRKVWVKAPSACKMVINFFNVNASPKYGNYRETEYEAVIYSNTPFE